MKTNTLPAPTAEQPRIVAHEEWLAARKRHLAREKELTRLRDQISAERRALPWERVDKNYIFEGPKGPVSLADLFGQQSQLIVYHFMFGPGWEEGCKSCSLIADHINGFFTHMTARDIAFAAISRAPLAELLPFQKRLDWTFNWVSSHGNDFNRDYHVSFTPEEMEKGEVYYNYGMQEFPVEEAPGLSVFAKNARGEVFHTYSSFGRGLDHLMGIYHFIDTTPKGRHEDPEHPMSWVRYHDRYDRA